MLRRKIGKATKICEAHGNGPVETGKAILQDYRIQVNLKPWLVRDQFVQENSHKKYDIYFEPAHYLAVGNCFELLKL